MIAHTLHGRIIANPQNSRKDHLGRNSIDSRRISEKPKLNLSTWMKILGRQQQII